MYTTIECLPTELWVSIFSHFEAHDIFKAFAHLNHYFDELLSSNYLTFYVRLKKQKYGFIQHATPYWLDGIRKRTVYLQTITESGFGYVPECLRLFADEFIQLKSLTITIALCQTNLICQIVEKLPSLEYLSVRSAITPKLFQTMLSINTLHVCRIQIMEHIKIMVSSMNIDSNINSNIEIFYISYSDPSYHPLTNLLLSHMPKLKYLEISEPSCYSYLADKLFDEPVSSLPALQTIKFTKGIGYFNSISFGHLLTKACNLKQIYIENSYGTCNSFRALVDFWWPIFEKLEKISINIQCDSIIHSSSEMDSYLQILSAKTNQFKNCFKIELIKRNFPTIRLTKFIIRKTPKKSMTG